MICTSSPPQFAHDCLELVITRSAYDVAVGRQLHDLDAFAVGQFRWQETDCGSQLLVERLELVQGMPVGAARPPHDCFLVLHVEHSARPGWSARQLVERTNPLPMQHAAGLALSVGPPARWEAAVRTSTDTVQAVDVISVRGPEPLELSRDESLAERVDPAGSAGGEGADLERLPYGRHAGAMGQATFQRVRRARVTLIGNGRNGSKCAQELSALGIRQLRCVDADVLELHNLLGTTGLDAADMGLPKTRSVAGSVLRMRPDVAITCIERSILEHGMHDELRRRPADLIVTCVDDDAARLAAWLLARATLTPHLDIASAVLPAHPNHQFLGDVRLFVPGGGHGCPVCVGGVADFEEVLYRIGAPAGTLRRGERVNWSAERAGSLPCLNSLVVGTALMMWLDCLSGSCRTSAWQRLRWLPGEGLRCEYAPVASAEQCPFCRS